MYPIGGHSLHGANVQGEVLSPRQVLEGSVCKLGSDPADPAHGGSVGLPRLHTLSWAWGPPRPLGKPQALSHLLKGEPITP